MSCDCKLENSTFGNTIYCQKCGMDLDLYPIIKKKKGVIEYYCCEGCKKNEKN